MKGQKRLDEIDEQLGDLLDDLEAGRIGDEAFNKEFKPLRKEMALILYADAKKEFALIEQEIKKTERDLEEFTKDGLIVMAGIKNSEKLVENIIATLKSAIKRQEQIYNTGCDLSTPALGRAYSNLLHKTMQVCNEKQYPLLYDPHAFVYMMQNKLIDPNIFVSGCFVSQYKTPAVASFAALPFKWLDQPVILHEPGAADKIVDIQAMLDFNYRYFVALRDTANSRIAQQSSNKIINLQNAMKENIPYLYRQKGI